MATSMIPLSTQVLTTRSEGLATCTITTLVGPGDRVLQNPIVYIEDLSLDIQVEFELPIINLELMLKSYEEHISCITGHRVNPPKTDDPQ